MIPFPFQVQVDPDDLIPKLPRPRDLHPFPTTQAIVRTRGPYKSILSHLSPFLPQVYEGHQGLVRCISVEPLGQWLASGISLLPLREREGGRERRGDWLLYAFIFMLKFIKHRDTALFRLNLNWRVIHYEWDKGSVML